MMIYRGCIWRIGVAIYEHCKDIPEELDRKLLRIVNHLNLGAVNHTHHRQLLIELNNKAALKAKKNLSFKSMREYLYNVQSYLPSDHLKRPDNHTLLCYQLLLEAEYFNNNIEPMIQLFDQLKQAEFEPYDKLSLNVIYVRLLACIDEFETAITVGLEGLSTIGISMARHPSKLLLFLDHLYFKFKIKVSDYYSTTIQSNDRAALITKELLTEVAVIGHNCNYSELSLKVIFQIIKVCIKFPS